MDIAKVQVLGAVAYGELKAYEGAKAEAEATDDPELRLALDGDPAARRRATAATRTMLLHMAWSGQAGATPLFAFLRMGRPHELLGALLAGHVRRMRAVGLAPFGLPLALAG